MAYEKTDLRAGSTRSTRIFLTASIALLALPGCATIQRENATEKERALAAAGFQMKFADTPERVSQIEGLPQRKLTHVPDGSKVRFVYADKNFCKCLYVGSEKAYDRYQKLSLEKETADERLQASMDWDAWGPWAWW